MAIKKIARPVRSLYKQAQTGVHEPWSLPCLAKYSHHAKKDLSGFPVQGHLRFNFGNCFDEVHCISVVVWQPLHRLDATMTMMTCPVKQGSDLPQGPECQGLAVIDRDLCLTAEMQPSKNLRCFFANGSWLEQYFHVKESLGEEFRRNPWHWTRYGRQRVGTTMREDTAPVERGTAGYVLQHASDV